MQFQGFSPANYLATFLVEEYGYLQPDQQHIDLFEKKLSALAKQQRISLKTLPSEEQIQALRAKVHAYIDLDKVFSA